jgi:thioester reductase-like protein
VSAAKACGGLLLDQLSRRHPDAFFVAYSSVAAVLGSPGQLAYGAANGYLDGLARQRRNQGFAGVAVNWGPWAGEGMAARTLQTLPLLDPQAALSALEAVLAREQTAPATVVLAQLEAQPGEQPSLPRLQALADQLQGLEDREAALQAIEACLLELLAELVGSDPDAFSRSTRLEELGLDSLMAVELASVVRAGLGVNLGLGALAGDPTVGSLAVHLLQLVRNPGGNNDPLVDLGEEARLPADLLAELSGRPECVEAGSAEGRPEQILLTGATGFLGAFLLADQLRRHPQLRVHCLVRAESPVEALERVRGNLSHYGLWKPDFLGRLVGLPGDLAKERFGLEPNQWLQLANAVQGVLHNGAQLSYVAPYGQLRAPNVGGTLEVLRLAAMQGLPVEFVSSTAVYEAAAYRGQDIDEQADLEEWHGIHLGYSQTKWVSERLVWHAARAGLPVRLYRPPLIAGHSRTGAWHEDDFLHRLVRGCLALGLAPRLDLALDLVPVDYVVRAIGAMAWQPISTAGSADVLHLHHPEPVHWIDLLNGLVERGAPLKPTALDSWLEALAQQPGNSLYPLQPFFRHRWGAEQLTYAELNEPARRARPLCARTLAVLDAHGVTCPGFDDLIGPYALTFLGSHG